MSNQIVITSGAKLRDLDDVIVATDGILTSLAFNVANGVPRLDENGKILVSQLPNSVMEFKGVWDATTNTPTLVNGTGSAGDVWLCNVAGTVNFGAGPIAFAVGDYAVYTGTVWARSSGATGTVTSVGVSRDGNALTITGSPVTTSGTINLGFSGNNTQYINGAGNLTTFPSLTGYVPYTGATQDVDLGAFKLNAQSLHIKGTGGLGHLGLKHQSANATASANEVSLFADSLGDLSWLNGNLYLSKFIISGNTANRSYTFPNANGTIALTSDISYPVTSVFGRTGAVVATSGDYNSDQVTEGTTNLYFTNTRARTAISLTTTGSTGASTYDNSTGVFNIPNYADQYVGTVTSVGLSAPTGFSVSGSPVTSSGTLALSFASGYSLPTNVKQSNWDDAYTWVAAFPTQTGNTGKFLTTDGSSLSWVANPLGTVTSVDMSVPTGLSVSGNPITTSGTLAVTLTAGYSIPTTANQSTWTTAYNRSLTSAAVTGTTTKTLTLNQQDGGTITASWTDINTDAVTSVFGRTGAVVATSGDYNTDQVTEGTTNLYFTNTRSRAAISLTTIGTSGAATYDNTTGVFNIPSYIGGVTSVFGRTGAVVATDGDYTLTLLGDVTITSPSSGQVLKYNGTFWINDTDANTGTVTSVAMTVPTGLSIAGSPITSSGTLAVTFAAGYSIPTNASQTTWDTAYTNRITSLTTTGTSGAATLTSNVLNIPQYQAALTNPVTGTGASGRVAYWSSASAITSEADFVWDSTNNRLGIGTNDPQSSIHIIEPTAARIRLQTGATGAALLDFLNNSVARWSIGVDNNQLYGKLENRGLGYDVFRFYDATNNLAIVPTNGNVLIGTTTDAGFKLNVNGGAGFTETTVTNTTSSAFSRVNADAGRDALTLYYDGTYYAGVGLNYGTNPNKFVIYFNSGTALTFNTSRQATFTNGVTASYFNANASLSVGLIAANTTFVDNASGTSRFLSYGPNSSTRGSIDFFQASSTNTLQQTPLSIAANGNSTFIGNVGIGQIAPSVLLDLKKAHASAYGSLVDLINLNGFFPGYDVDAQRAGIAAGVPNLGNTTYGWMSFRTRGSDGYLDRMFVTPIGVYVNTSTGVSGGGALQVNGNVNINGVFQINGVTIGGGGGSGITGSGTTGYLPKWTGSTSLGNSILYDDGSRLTLQSGTGQNDTFGYMQVYYDGSGTSPNAGYTMKNYQGTSQMMQWTIYGLRLGSRIMTNTGQGSVFITHGNDAVGMTLFGSSGNLNVGSGNSDSGYKLKIEGSIYATADVIAYSDISVKENIRPIENVLTRINNSRGVLYDRIDTNTKDNIGFIAQELEKEFPELITTNNDGTKGVKYQNAVAVLFEAIKEQQKQINELKNSN